LDRAIETDDAALAAEALPLAWAAMREVRLEVPFARLYGETLHGLGLEGEAGQLAHRVALLSPIYEAAARSREPVSTHEALWRAVATGEIEGARAMDPRGAAVLAGFGDGGVPVDLQELLAQGRLGEVLLRAVASFQRGLDGDHRAVGEAIATLRAAGQEDAARRAALQFLILSDEP
jgi:hypothetical protein